MDATTKQELIKYLIPIVAGALISGVGKLFHWLGVKAGKSKQIPANVKNWLAGIDQADIDAVILKAQSYLALSADEKRDKARAEIKRLIPGVPTSVANWIVEDTLAKVIKSL